MTRMPAKTFGHGSPRAPDPAHRPQDRTAKASLPPSRLSIVQRCAAPAVARRRSSTPNTLKRRGKERGPEAGFDIPWPCPRSTGQGHFILNLNLVEIVMNEKDQSDLELQIIELGDAKELTMGIQAPVHAEDNPLVFGRK